MANAKRKNNSRLLTIILCVIAVIIIAAYEGSDLSGFQEPEQNAGSLLSDIPNNDLIIYIADTGNSDCIILRTPNHKAIMIDAGESDDSQKILKVLDQMGISEIDVLIATHPHADHIGSMASIINQVPVKQMYMTDFVSTTKTYEHMLNTIENNHVAVKRALAGDAFEVDGIRFTILNPFDQEYDDANNSSIVLLAEYKEASFLFEGDAEVQAINDMLQSFSNIMDVDFIKIGHHGSHNATTQELLDVTTPKFAVINCGKGNDYGHPHKEVIDLLNQNNIRCFRTDQNGDIVFFTNGESIDCRVEKQ